MKKIMILITTISIIFIIGCTPKVIEYVEYEGLKFELNNDGNYTVVGYLDEHQEHYVIPSKVKGKEVTIIGNNAFKDNSNIISIVFPNTIVSINQGAFYHCTSLLGVIIPESVQLIGIGAFSGCSAITNVIVLGETKIEWSAFFNCTALVNVVIPYVTHIGGGSFKKTPSLKHINIPSAKTIQREAFRYSGLEMAVIGGNVKNIGDHVFYDCVNLKSVILEEGVETLGQGAFFGCNLLDSINLPNSITSIGGGGI